jgi:predicted metal-dependent hydrolase
MITQKMAHKIKRRKTKWVGHILRRNCLLKHVTGGNIEGVKEEMKKTREEMKAAKDDVKKARSLNLEDEALDRNNWKTSSGETMDLP